MLASDVIAIIYREKLRIEERRRLVVARNLLEKKITAYCRIIPTGSKYLILKLLGNNFNSFIIRRNVESGAIKNSEGLLIARHTKLILTLGKFP